MKRLLFVICITWSLLGKSQTVFIDSVKVYLDSIPNRVYIDFDIGINYISRITQTSSSSPVNTQVLNVYFGDCNPAAIQKWLDTTVEVSNIFPYRLEIYAFIDSGLQCGFPEPYMTDSLILEPWQIGMGEYNKYLASQIRVYPNPARDKISLFGLENFRLTGVSIHDASGRELRNFPGNSKEFPVKDLPKGLYFIHLATEKGVLVKKVQVE